MKGHEENRSLRGTSCLCHGKSQSQAAGDGHELGLRVWEEPSPWALTRGGCGRNVGEFGGTGPCSLGISSQGPREGNGTWVSMGVNLQNATPELCFINRHISDQSKSFQLSPILNQPGGEGPTGICNLKKSCGSFCNSENPWVK